jgi:hypothetical protein
MARKYLSSKGAPGVGRLDMQESLNGARGAPIVSISPGDLTMRYHRMMASAKTTSPPRVWRITSRDNEKHRRVIALGCPGAGFNFGASAPNPSFDPPGRITTIKRYLWPLTDDGF